METNKTRSDSCRSQPHEDHGQDGPAAASLGRLQNWKFAFNTSHLILVLKASIMLTMILAFYFQDLTIVFTDAMIDEAASHILIIPLLSAYIIYRKRKMLKAAVSKESSNQTDRYANLALISGILLLTTSILLYWSGSYTFTPLEYHILTLPLFTAGLTLIFFGHQALRQAAFAIAFLTFLMPPPSEILYGIGSALSVTGSQASNAIINTLGIPSVLSEQYGNPTITITRPNNATLSFTVDIACSGIFNLITFAVFVTFIAYVSRAKIVRKASVFAIGLPLIYLLNILRLTMILLIGYYIGEELALQAFHTFGGWALVFLGTLLLLLISEKLIKIQIFPKTQEQCTHPTLKQIEDKTSCPHCGHILQPLKMAPSKSDAIKIFTAATVLILLLSIQVPVFALTEAQPAVITGTSSGQVSVNILPNIPGYNLTFLYRDNDFEELAKQNLSLVYLYTPHDKAKASIWIALEIASARSSLHRWEYCLVTYASIEGYRPRVNQIELTDIGLTDNPPIIGRYFIFQNRATNVTEAILYWYETPVFTLNSTSYQQHAKISVITYPRDLDDLSEIKQQLFTVASEVVNYWQPVKTWSQITMLISQNGIALSALAASLVAMPIAIYYYDKTRQRKANATSYPKLSRLSRQIIDATKKAEKGQILTLENMRLKVEETTGTPLDADQLLQELSELESMRIIERSIANSNDNPVQTWRANIP